MKPFTISTLAMCGLLLMSTAGCNFWAKVEGKSEPVKPLPGPIPVTTQPAQAPTTSDHPAVIESVRVTVPALRAGKPPAEYIVGPNDILYVNVFDQPQMGSPVVSVGNRPAIGSRVDGDGNIQLPMVNTVSVAGLTLREIQTRLQERFAQFIKEPWVVVEVLEYGSQPIYLVGQFNQAGVVYMDRPTNIVQAVALGRGLNGAADLRGAALLRDKRIVNVDLYELLTNGAVEQNLWLHPGDTIYVPDSRERRVWVLGEVDRPGPVDMVHGKLTLVEAISATGGFETVGSTLKYVRIIRSYSATRGELIVVDLERTLKGEVMPFALMPGDIVYIPKSGVGEWNDALRELLPTIQVVGAVVSPFAQIIAATSNND